MPDDYWLPVRQRWDALIPMLLESHHGPREPKFVIKRRLNFFATLTSPSLSRACAARASRRCSKPSGAGCEWAVLLALSLAAVALLVLRDPAAGCRVVSDAVSGPSMNQPA